VLCVLQAGELEAGLLARGSAQQQLERQQRQWQQQGPRQLRAHAHLRLPGFEPLQCSCPDPAARSSMRLGCSSTAGQAGQAASSGAAPAAPPALQAGGGGLGRAGWLSVSLWLPWWLPEDVHLVVVADVECDEGGGDRRLPSASK
jgi:hypothetical protein